MASYLGKSAPTNGCIYVCNLPEGTDINMMAEFFGTIGLIKVRAILDYHVILHSACSLVLDVVCDSLPI